MDPALQELINQPHVNAEVEALIKLTDPEARLPGVRIISRFGMIATCRLKKKSIGDVHDDKSVISLKATRKVRPDPLEESLGNASVSTAFSTDRRRPPDFLPTGNGVIVAVIDWGLDFVNPAFRKSDGSTRLIALWDQGENERSHPNKYGYGKIHTQSDINNALIQVDPYASLGYHPSSADRTGTGSHGTHVTDIAAGNGLAGGPASLAAEADIIFVHLADRNTSGLANLGNSVRILEAIDFIRNTARNRPFVINLSVGQHGGPHDGSTLCEQAFDNLLLESPHRMIVQSAGNYFDKRIHTSGLLTTGVLKNLPFVVNEKDRTPNELEVWYSGGDTVSVCVKQPNNKTSVWISAGEKIDLLDNGHVIGRLYHRAHDPNNGDNHVNLFLYPNAPSGTWQLSLRPITIFDGSFHSWLERDDGCRNCQTRFTPDVVDQFSTTGSLANATLPLVVGAFDAHRDAGVSAFSSAGPTRDHRPKPDLVAPGVDVLAARSTPRGFNADSFLLTRKSGTSMAAPHVTGFVAALLEIFPRPLSCHAIRKIALACCDAPRGCKESIRYGAGFLNAGKLPEVLKMYSSNNLASMKNSFDNSQQSENPVCFSLINNARSIYRAASRNEDLPTTIASQFTILGRPGEAPTEPIAMGDVFLGIALGQPGFENMSVLGTAALEPGDLPSNVVREGSLPGTYAKVTERFRNGTVNSIGRRILDKYGRVPLGHVLLRQLNDVQKSSEDSDGGIAAGISNAIGVAQLVTPILTRGEFSVTVESLAAEIPTAPYLDTHEISEDVQITCKHWAGDGEYWFKVTSTYNEDGILGVKILPLPNQSSSGPAKFDVKFKPSVSRKTGKNVLEIQFNMEGSWDPWIGSKFSFQGILAVNAKGEFSKMKITFSEDDQVQFGKRTNRRRSTIPATRIMEPPKLFPENTHSVYFAVGSYSMSDDAMNQTNAWISKLNPKIIQRIKDNTRSIQLTGYTSGTGSVSKNQLLARRRVDAVKQFLIDRLGLDAQIKPFAEGELKIQQDGKEDASKRRVDISIVSD